MKIAPETSRGNSYTAQVGRERDASVNLADVSITPSILPLSAASMVRVAPSGVILRGAVPSQEGNNQLAEAA